MGWGGPEWDGHVCSLGYEIAQWIETYCCHGPGDVQGEPVELDEEWLKFLVDAYEIDPFTGRKKRSEAVLSRPKGRAKSELAGFVATAEAFAPVRFDGWNAAGQPVARPITSPLIKCLATEEGQAGETFQNITFIATDWGPDEHPDIYGGTSGARKYQSATKVYLDHGGEIRLCASGAASKDGGKESFVVADETHLYILPELRGMYATISRNLPKRAAAEPWLLQTTTAYRPGEQSVAEATLTAWRKDELGPEVLVDHRQATGKIDIRDKAHTMKQLREVNGPAAEWMNLEGRYATMLDPRKCEDEATAARYYLNRIVAGADNFLDPLIWDKRKKTEVVEPGTAIAMGFDGSINDDATVLIGSRMSDGFIFPIGIWAKPAGRDGLWWEVPRSQVLATIKEAFSRYTVARLYADPHEWRSDIDDLADKFGERVMAFPTDSPKRAHGALDRLRADILTGVLFHAGDPVMSEHVGNAFVRRQGQYRLVRKEYPNSDRKIDSIVGAALAYEARADAITDGWDTPQSKLSRVTGSTRNY